MQIKINRRSSLSERLKKLGCFEREGFDPKGRIFSLNRKHNENVLTFHTICLMK